MTASRERKVLFTLVITFVATSCSSSRPAPQNDLSLIDGAASFGSDAHDGAPTVDGEDMMFQGDSGNPSTEEVVIDLVKRHRFDMALEALDKLPETQRGTPRMSYLRGRLLERLDRPSEAADAMDIEGDPLPSGIARDARVRRATGLALSGRCKVARPLIEELYIKRIGNREHIKALRATCTFEVGQYEEAIKQLRPVAVSKSRDVDTVEIRLMLAEALEKTGARDEAQSALRSLLIERPEHRKIGLAEASLAVLSKEVSFSVTERIKRAKRLIARRQFDAAIAELDAARRPTKRGQLAQWLHLRGMALYRKRHHYDEASKILAQSAKLGGPTAIDDAFHAARALSRADHDDEAVVAYRRLVKAHPRHSRAAEAEYLAAWLDLRHDRARGEVLMERFLKGPRAKRSEKLRREALWHLGFRAFERRRYMQAAGLLDQYAKTGSRGEVRGRGLYWQARALESLGRKELASKVYRAAIKVEPLHWYALLARQRLQALGEEPGAPFPQPRGTKSPSPLPEPTLPEDVSFFVGIGLIDDALDAMERQEKALRAAAPRGRELESLLSLYGSLGGARRAFRLSWATREELEKAPSVENRWAWEAAYPRPYLPLVEKAAQKHGVDPAHVYATMRQESGYAEGVVSHADAIGLLQLLPSTAKSIGRKIGVDVEREMLFDPRWNIELGVAEIAAGLQATKGCLPLTIASYNAGEKNVERWLTETGDIELDRFVERIPFDETRNYVRRVTSHLARYRYLYGDSDSWPFELPDKVGPPPAP